MSNHINPIIDQHYVDALLHVLEVCRDQLVANSKTTLVMGRNGAVPITAIDEMLIVGKRDSENFRALENNE
jgi:hypothetical protein